VLALEGPATAVIAGLAFVLGAALGSFANVVIRRLPAGESLLRPPSHCPVCQHGLRASDNVPILSWLWLRGRCRYCRTPIPLRYPLVEAASGGIFLLALGAYGASWQVLAYGSFGIWLLVLAAIDLETLTLPETLTRSGLLAGLGVRILLGWQGAGPGIAQQLALGMGGAALGLWLLEGIALAGSLALGQPAMGGGDAKLAAGIGAWLGWQQLLLAGFLACLSGAIAGGAVIAVGARGRRQPLPFGPFLALGAGLSLMGGEALLAAYRDWLWP